MYIFISFGIAVSYSNCVYIFKAHQTLFQSDCAILHSHKQCLRVPIFLHSHHHLSEFIFYFIKPTHRSKVVSYCGFDLNFLNDF